MNNITNLPEWKRLQQHQQDIADVQMRDLFKQDAKRFSQFSLSLEGLFLDYSKNRITQETLALLCDLAKAQNLQDKITALFAGDAINTTEQRPALHTALRNGSKTQLYLDTLNVTEVVADTLTNLKNFSDTIRHQQLLGATGKPINTIINVGIGGSNLGPLLGVEALRAYAQTNLTIHFVSNVDGTHLAEVLEKINPETSLFIVSSKSFTTIETLTHAEAIKTWLQEKLGTVSLDTHFAAVTANIKKAVAFGVPATHIFPLWDWVGGRYSVWSAIGLPLLISIGYENFLQFLNGAAAMDEHFKTAEFDKNIPVMLALLGIWYVNFFHANNHAIIPYNHLLARLPTYIQQADMESNGKSISKQGTALDYATGPIIWGEQGSNAQHAFHQLLHQGKHFSPVDFILVGNSQYPYTAHQDVLISSGLSQAKALMQGKSLLETIDELTAEGHSLTDAKKLAPHKMIPGNRPSNTLFLTEISPFNLGMLLSLYEHKIFVQGAIWEINSFDQWGVELGKQLLPQILSDLQNKHASSGHDSSTQGLIAFYKNIQLGVK